MRGATQTTDAVLPVIRISIHAPHAGRDYQEALAEWSEAIFQSTRPMRGATSGKESYASNEIFQSTRPMRGATLSGVSTLPADFRISIHAPHAGRDRPGDPHPLRRHDISIHAPHAGRDSPGRSLVQPLMEDFNPRAPCGARLSGC